MPLYRYKALNARGEMLDGQMEAASDGEVVLRLQEQGHLPIEAKLASEGGGDSAWRALFKPKPMHSKLAAATMPCPMNLLRMRSDRSVAAMIRAS